MSHYPIPEIRSVGSDIIEKISHMECSTDKINEFCNLLLGPNNIPIFDRMIILLQFHDYNLINRVILTMEKEYPHHWNIISNNDYYRAIKSYQKELKDID